MPSILSLFYFLLLFINRVEELIRNLVIINFAFFIMTDILSLQSLSTTSFSPKLFRLWKERCMFHSLLGCVWENNLLYADYLKCKWLRKRNGVPQLRCQVIGIVGLKQYKKCQNFWTRKFALWISFKGKCLQINTQVWRNEYFHTGAFVATTIVTVYICLVSPIIFIIFSFPTQLGIPWITVFIRSLSDRKLNKDEIIFSFIFNS